MSNIIGQFGNQFLFLDDSKEGAGIVIDPLSGQVVASISSVIKEISTGYWEEIYDRELLQEASTIVALYGVGQVKVNPPLPLTITYADVPYPPLHSHCTIDPKIPIYTSKGWVAIKDVKIDDLVLTHKGRFRKVTQLHRTPKQTTDVVKFTTGKNHALTLTSNHPVFLNGKWADASEIKVGDKINFLSHPCKVCKKIIPYYNKFCSRACVNVNSAKRLWENEIVHEECNDYRFFDAEIKKVEKWTLRKPRTLFNLSVEGDESYVAKGFVVHNCRCVLLPVLLSEYR